MHTQRGEAILGVKLNTSLVRASDYCYYAGSVRRRCEPTADRASTLRLLTSRLSRLQTMGYKETDSTFKALQQMLPNVNLCSNCLTRK